MGRRSTISGLAPPEIVEALSRDAKELLPTNLRAAAESRDLLDDFEAADVPLLFVKGLTGAALAYRQPLLKMSSDIDLLVAPQDVLPAGELLTRRGYRLLIPHLRPTSAAGIDGARNPFGRARMASPSSFTAGSPTTQRLIPCITIDSPSENVAVAPGIRLPTLARDELFAYLCVHGSSSAWFRLKWISDLAGLVHGQSGEAIERLYQWSQALGAERATGQALLLADRLFGTLGDTGLRKLLERDRPTLRLADAAYAQLTGPPVEPTSTRFGTWRIHLTQFALKRGLGFKLGEFTRQARDAAASLGRRIR